MNKLVSIIIPVYNAEKFLTETVTPFLSLQKNDVEVLLIDDGSTDSSSQLCDFYASDNICVKTFHIKNSGVANARNFGINHASGKYLYFIDSDDVVNIDAFWRLVNIMEERKYKMIVAGFVNCDENLEILDTQLNDYKGICDAENASAQLMRWQMKCHLGSFLVEKDTVQTLRFVSGVRYGEDVEYIHKCMLLSKNIFVSMDWLVKYRSHAESAMHKVDLRRFDTYFARKRYRDYVIQNHPTYNDLIKVIDNYNIPEVLAEHISLMCTEGIPYRKLKKFLNETGIDEVVRKTLSNSNVEKKFCKTLCMWEKNSLLFYFTKRCETYIYQIRSAVGRIKRRLLGYE